MASLAQTIAELQVQANALVVKLNMLAALVPPAPAPAPAPAPVPAPVPAPAPAPVPVAKGGRSKPRTKKA